MSEHSMNERICVIEDTGVTLHMLGAGCRFAGLSAAYRFPGPDMYL